MGSFQRKKWDFIFPTVLKDCKENGIDLHQILSLSSTLSSPKILEYGSGTGEASLRCACEFPQAEVIGVDVHDASKSIFSRAKEAKDIQIKNLPITLDSLTFLPLVIPIMLFQGPMQRQ